MQNNHVSSFLLKMPTKSQYHHAIPPDLAILSSNSSGAVISSVLGDADGGGEEVAVEVTASGPNTGSCTCSSSGDTPQMGTRSCSSAGDVLVLVESEGDARGRRWRVRSPNELPAPAIDSGKPVAAPTGTSSILCGSFNSPYTSSSGCLLCGRGTLEDGYPALAWAKEREEERVEEERVEEVGGNLHKAQKARLVTHETSMFTCF